MMPTDFSVGDRLFGYPIVILNDQFIIVTLPSGTVSEPIQLSFDRAQFGEGVRYTLFLAGSWIPA